MATPVDSTVYYHGVFWNSYDEVVRHLNVRAFDLEVGNWCEHLRRVRGSAFELALSLNCGTGWAERGLIDAGAVERIVAVDFLDDLLATARAEATGYPIEFVQMDTNSADFPVRPYDLVVNHAAGHHITHIDRVFRRAWELVDPAGALVTWDYTGPHRNQYSARVWSAACAVNEQLPAEYRAAMDYPHLPTMLATDPTEAVHSELVLETMGRYFRFEHVRRLGGPIAYLLLTHNDRLFAAPRPQRDELVAMILRADVAHVEAFPEDNLFTYAISSPRPASDLDPVQLEIWTQQEDERERVVASQRGRYYLPTEVERDRDPAALADLVPASPPLQPYDVARRGPRFVLAALVRTVPIALPFTLPLLRRVRRSLTSLRARIARARA